LEVSGVDRMPDRSGLVVEAARPNGSGEWRIKASAPGGGTVILSAANADALAALYDVEGDAATAARLRQCAREARTAPVWDLFAVFPVSPAAPKGGCAKLSQA